jgi:hypothetical protein
MQGFGIGKPMPLDDTFAWLATRGAMATRTHADMPEAETAAYRHGDRNRHAPQGRIPFRRTAAAQNAP